MRYDVAVVGGGVLGWCVAHWLLARGAGSVCVIDKEARPGAHASSRNTGVVHSPFYLDPASRGGAARDALLSAPMWEALASSGGAPWERRGLLEVAADGAQHRALARYERWGRLNGMPEGSLEMLDASGAARAEPGVRCHSALLCAGEACTDFGALTGLVARGAARMGARGVSGRVEAAGPGPGGEAALSLSGGASVRAGYVVNCAGGGALRVARMMGHAAGHTALHFRGEYWRASPGHEGLASRCVYSVPESPEYPFLDPHWVRRAGGGAEVGPNAVPVAGPEAYSGAGGLAEAASKAREVLCGPARRLAADPAFLALAAREWRSSLSRSAMVGRVRGFLPAARPGMFGSRGTAGVRSPVVGPDGRLARGPTEAGDGLSWHVIGYDSPGATGAPAYAARLVSRLASEGLVRLRGRGRPGLWGPPDQP